MWKLNVKFGIEREDEIELVPNPFDNWYINRIFPNQIMYLIAIKVSSVFFSANSSIHTVAFFTYTSNFLFPFYQNHEVPIKS